LIPVGQDHLTVTSTVCYLGSKEEGGFPEITELKQRVSEMTSIQQSDLGHMTPTSQKLSRGAVIRRRRLSGTKVLQGQALNSMKRA
jgi:hypothetical protein